MTEDLTFGQLLATQKMLADDRYHESAPLPDGHRLAVERFDCEGVWYFRRVCLCGWIGPAHREHDRRQHFTQ